MLIVAFILFYFTHAKGFSAESVVSAFGTKSDENATIRCV